MKLIRFGTCSSDHIDQKLHGGSIEPLSLKNGLVLFEISSKPSSNTAKNDQNQCKQQYVMGTKSEKHLYISISLSDEV
jgi:hypothetical protein